MGFNLSPGIVQFHKKSVGSRLADLQIREEKKYSHTPLVAMSSRPPPDLYCKFKANTSSITLKTGNKRKKFKASTLYWHCIKTSNIWVGGQESRQWRTQQKQLARHIGHMTYTQAPAVYEKNIFHLFRFTQPVKNYS